MSRLVAGIALLIAGCFHQMPGWDDPTPLLLLFGGILGGFVRHYAGQTVRVGAHWWESFVNMFRQKWTLWHILSGGALAVMVPRIFERMYNVDLIGPPLFLLLVGFLVGGFGNYVFVALLWRFGVFKDDPRANKPENGGG